MALQNSVVESISKYLADKYYIPNYQREYSWEEVELTDFWDDLTLLIESDEDDTHHFFGQIVVHDDDEDKKKYIIDGQQRTITSVIFLRALQLAFIELYENYRIDQANIYNSEISTMFIADTKGYRLTLGEIDRDYFRENILMGTVDSCANDRVKSHDAYARLSNSLPIGSMRG